MRWSFSTLVLSSSIMINSFSLLFSTSLATRLFPRSSFHPIHLTAYNEKKPILTTNTLSSFYVYSFSPSPVEIGLVTNKTLSSRRVVINELLDENLIKKNQNNLTSGQLKVSFGSPDVAKPFVLINAIGPTQFSASFYEQHSIKFPRRQISKLKLTDEDWTVRGILGIDSLTFLNNFTAGLGVGAAIINQNINGNITLPKVTPMSTAQTSISPSIVANVNWLGCATCLAGHGGSLSFQIAADQYPNMNLNVLRYESSFLFSQKWQWSEMLVFNIRI